MNTPRTIEISVVSNCDILMRGVRGCLRKQKNFVVWGQPLSTAPIPAQLYIVIDWDEERILNFVNQLENQAVILINPISHTPYSLHKYLSAGLTIIRDFSITPKELAGLCSHIPLYRGGIGGDRINEILAEAFKLPLPVLNFYLSVYRKYFGREYNFAIQDMQKIYRKVSHNFPVVKVETYSHNIGDYALPILAKTGYFKTVQQRVEYGR